MGPPASPSNLRPSSSKAGTERPIDARGYSSQERTLGLVTTRLPVAAPPITMAYLQGEERQPGAIDPIPQATGSDRTGHTPRWAPWGCPHQVLPAGFWLCQLDIENAIGTRATKTPGLKSSGVLTNFEGSAAPSMIEPHRSAKGARERYRR